MKRSYSISEIRAADARALQKGEALMERAAEALAQRVRAVMREKGFPDALFVCGGGNNGGDGFLAAQLLHEQGADVAVLCLSEKFSHGCAEAAKRYRGVLFGRIPRRRFAFLVDCVFGTGLTRAPEGDAAALIRFIADSGAYVLSCDLSSGLSENGIAYAPCVHADETLTLGGLKNALLMCDGADVAGKIGFADIGLSPEGGAEVWEDGDVRSFFPARKSNSNKGSYGSACIFAGSVRYVGAPLLAAGACLKSGAGYVKLLASEPLFSHAAGRLLPVVLREYKAVDGDLLSSDCIAMGMGAGVNESVYAQFLELLTKYTGTLVLDADALNALAVYGAEPLKQKSCRVIITPHPAEFARLLGKETEEVLSNAAELARGFAREYGVVVLLKNNRSLIADGERLAINVTGSPALAKGGSGDVLSGFLTGTCARGVPPYEAACVSSYLLGRAGELAARDMGEYSPDATDIISYLPKGILSLSKTPQA